MRVIVATDGSVESDIARTVLRKLPLPKGTAITVAMATHLPVPAGIALDPMSASMAGAVAADTWRVQRQVARQTVERVAEGLRAEGLQAEGVVLEGETADELLRRIAHDKAEMIVVGCGVKSNFAAFFLGSVSRKLVLYSGASVLIGKRYTDSKSEESCRWLADKPMLDLLVAVDGSKGADLALETLENLKEPAFKNVFVVSVERLLNMGSMDPGLLLPSHEADKEATESIAKAAAERIGKCGRHVEFLTTFGRPSEEIVRIAKEKNVDLVMLGANRHGALDRLVLGSCAYETATSAPCSVLVLRDALPFEGGIA